MTDDDIRALREALAAWPTPGPWVACGPSFGDPLPRFLNEVVAPDDEDGGETVCRAMEGAGADADADMAYIAAASPDRIARLLDELERLRAENFALAAGQCVSATADEGGRPYCKEVIALRAERDALKEDAERWRWGVKHAAWYRNEGRAHIAIPVAADADLSCVAMRVAAIDAARGKT